MVVQLYRSGAASTKAQQGVKETKKAAPGGAALSNG